MKTFQLIFKAIVCVLCFIFAQTSWAQNVGISAASGFTPDASAGLDISFTNKGLLVPRVALTASNAAGPITSPTTSLLIYNTATAGTAPTNVVPGYYYWNGVAWTMLSTTSQTATSSWSTTGNTGITPGTNFLGTLDLNSVRIKTNKLQRFLADSLGSVSVGLAPAFTAGSAREKFLVDAGTSALPTPTGAFNVISGKGYLDGYLQLNIQNTSPTASASSDIVASNDQATESINFIDMGINSSTYSGTTATSVTAGPNTAYLYATGSDFSIGNATSGKNLLFFTGGTGTNERMRIDGTGNVGIGTIAPATKLHVFGANPLTLSGVVTGTSTSADSLLTITSGLVRKLPISTFASSTGSWATTGNAGTTAGTNFIGTTDAVDFVFKANNVERMRIVNGSSAVTGTTGDITVGDANSGTLRSNKELVLRQDGDTFGPSTLRLRNRNGQNGAVFETTGGSANLVDFIFNTGPIATPISSNIRFETRASSIRVTGNSTEWQIGQPDVTNGGATLVVGASGTGSNSAFLTGKVGIGTNSPTALLQLKAGTATANTAPLKLTSGTNLTMPETGAVEFDGTNYFATASTTRYTLAKTLTATATLDFPSTGPSSSNTLTIPVTGAADGDAVALGVPNASVSANSIYTAYVSAANTVTIKFTNLIPLTTPLDPASGTFRVSVLKY